jgi:serine/threonine protein kinase/class 3 adenylate cyclase/ActR/RegA family two-component response regulator
VKTKILVIDDDPGIRRGLALILKAEGYRVTEAESGRAGLELASDESPDLVLCDVSMPEMDGYEVVERLRRIPALASTPFIFLTARDERADVRKGMNLGADDYLTKPFTRAELIEAVAVRLKKLAVWREALAQQLIVGGDLLRRRFRSGLTGEARHAAVEEAALPGTGNSIVEATVLFTDIRGFTAISERLSVVEIAALLNAYLQRACEPIIAAGGKIVKFIGDGIMAVFPHTDDDLREHQALRAIQTGLGLSIIAHHFRNWMHAQYADRGLPEFAIGVGIHTGEVTLCQVGAPGQEDFTAIGDTVNIASRLEGQTKELGWPVVASEATIGAAGDAVVHGAHRVVHLRGRTKPVLVYEVLGLKNLPATTDRGTGNLSELLQEALAGNAKGAATAAKAALRETLEVLMSDQSRPSASAPLRIKNYSVIGKLGDANGTAMYLGERDVDGKKVAIKIRHSRTGEDRRPLQRYVQEAARVSRLDHPNIAVIFDLGFADDLAYIVMEYFPAGCLRDVVGGPLPPRQALSLLAQAATALAEVHRQGIVHGGLKPENFMVRENGEIALSGFEDAKDETSDTSIAPRAVPLTSLYYRSPEHAAGAKVDQRSDLYALGVIFFETLTGHRPYTSDSADELTRQIVSAPPPRLPAELAHCQELVDAMLAKDPAWRYPSAVAVLKAIDAVWTRAALNAAGAPLKH